MDNIKKLIYSIDGLFTYDTGCTDSGIHDEQLRYWVIKELHGMSENYLKLFMNNYIV